MRFLFAAFLFLVSVAGFSFLAKTLYQGVVEAEFEEMATASLEKAGLEGVTVRFNHHDANLTGYVDSEEQRAQILTLLEEAVPLARISEAAVASLPIRPTLPPSLLVSKSPSSREVLIKGVMGSDGEANRELLSRRLRSLDGVDKVTDEIVLDPRQLPFKNAAELTTLIAELLRESDGARLDFREGGLKLSGQVSNSGRYESIHDLAKRVEPENLEIALELLEPEIAPDPSEFTVTRNRFGVVLSGRLASLDSKDRLLGIFADLDESLRVTDRIEIDQTLNPVVWEKEAGELVPVLLQAFRGEMTAELREEQVRLTGTAETEGAYKRLLSMLQDLNEGGGETEILTDVVVAEEIVDPAPEGAKVPELLITFQPELMILTGFLPDVSFLEPLSTQLKSWNGEYAIQNELAETPSRSEVSWYENLSEFLEEAAIRVDSGVFRFSQEGLKMEGMTREMPDKQILQNVAVNSVPSGYSIENLLSHEDEEFPEPELLPEDREKLSEALKKYPIYFPKNSDLIAPDERERLKAVSSLLEETGFPVDIVVTGFADNVGNAAYNEKLSLRRAESVSKALEASGIASERISTESKGEDVSRVSSRDRWKSRRVEISLAPEPEEAPEQ